ncbi:MAG: protein kinase [Novosphingobium sp.]
MSIDAQALIVVEEALGIEDAAARAQFVAERCGGAAALRARVEELLALEGTAIRLTPTESFVRPLSVIDVIPERIGPFKVTGEIARGGMGAVVKAERDDGVFQQTVAIKLIRSDLASERAKARFAEERRILARLRHPGIVRILDGGEEGGRPWLAMDLVDGLPITEALRGADEARRLDAYEAVCEAVAYAHRNLVIHADIKPSNVLMSADGQVHLLDFGIARLIVEIDGEETGDPYPLTKGYAAPERGVGVAPTIPSDVFSLGVLLLGMLGWDLPGEGADYLPGTRLPLGQLTGDLAVIAGKALAEQPENRYADVGELLADLRRHRMSEPVLARGDAGWRYVAGKFARRHRRPLALAALAAVLLAGTAVVSTVSYVRAERARAEADKRFVELRGLARFMLTELSDRLSDAPGTVAARARIADVAGTYLDRLRAVPDAPLDLRLDTARGYYRLARLQGLSGVANLGRPDAAARSLDRAEAILAELPPTDADALALQGDIAIARWTLASGTKGPEWTSKAQDFYRRALALDPGRKDALLGGLILERSRGFDLTTADRPREALPILRAGLAKLRATTWPEAQRRDAKLLEVSYLARIGDAIYYAGDIPGALPPYRESALLIRAELAKAPSLMWEEKLGEAAWNISGTLGDIPGRQAEALAEAERGIAEMQRTLSFGPDAAIETRLLILLGHKALLLGLLGRPREAAEASQQSIDLRRRRLAETPGDVTRRRDLAVVMASHADILAKTDGRTAACGAAREGLELLEGLRATGDLAEKDIRTDVPKLEDAVKRHCR